MRCGEWGLLSSCVARASHCGGFFCCRAWALGCWASVVVVHGLSCSAVCGIKHSCCCWSVTQQCLILCDPMDCSMLGFPVLHHLKLMSIESVMLSNHLILCRPLLLLPSILPSISVFSKESLLYIRWPKYWSFCFSISPSSEYSGLISLKIWLKA